MLVPPKNIFSRMLDCMLVGRGDVLDIVWVVSSDGENIRVRHTYTNQFHHSRDMLSSSIKVLMWCLEDSPIDSISRFRGMKNIFEFGLRFAEITIGKHETFKFGHAISFRNSKPSPRLSRLVLLMRV